jgi:hypothetical protein
MPVLCCFEIILNRRCCNGREASMADRIHSPGSTIQSMRKTLLHESLSTEVEAD